MRYMFRRNNSHNARLQGCAWRGGGRARRSVAPLLRAALLILRLRLRLARRGRRAGQRRRLPRVAASRTLPAVVLRRAPAARLARLDLRGLARSLEGAHLALPQRRVVEESAPRALPLLLGGRRGGRRRLGELRLAADERHRRPRRGGGDGRLVAHGCGGVVRGGREALGRRRLPRRARGAAVGGEWRGRGVGVGRHPACGGQAAVGGRHGGGVGRHPRGGRQAAVRRAVRRHPVRRRRGEGGGERRGGQRGVDGGLLRGRHLRLLLEQRHERLLRRAGGRRAAVEEGLHPRVHTARAAQVRRLLRRRRGLRWQRRRVEAE
mmetsp:Transcript_13287/g.31615  ORF Transcript_13287/g.31615 Transcript_13287/m.31615 type:complete len:321 (+) Transcript_13287:206-1168(+)